MQSLCTLRNRCRQRPRNTRYQADATPYLGRTCTGWIAPACGWRTYSDPFLPMLNSRLIDLPRNERAINQICSLERSVQRSGRDQISHPVHGRDDIANSIAGAADIAANFTLFDASFNWTRHDDGDPAPANASLADKAAAEAEANAQWRQLRFNAFVMNGDRLWR
jgi:hypothetical protein